MARKPPYAGMKLPDYYNLLQVSPQASQEVIHGAFLALMKIHQAANNHAGNDMARRLNEAYAVLKNSSQRQDYDAQRRTPVGTIIGDYRLIEEIAEGGFGTTYRGEHVLTGLPVCIKDCHQIHAEDNEILMQEAAAMWDLRHFSIPAVRNLIKLDDGRLVLVMSFIPGLTLEKVVKKIGAVPPEHVAWITERALNALKYIHYHGVIHGDIKPQNIIIQNETHTISIVDFGLSLIKPTARTSNKGYTEYMAPPEQLKGTVLLPESDFYSLGVTMIYALSGDIEAVVRREVPENTPDPLCGFIRRLIVRDVKGRPKWEDEDLCDTIRDIRMKCFGRASTNLKPIPGL